jgi:SAM-dependent methyltransferase
VKSDTLRTMPAAFDQMAERYDADFTASALGRVLRARAWERFDSAFAGRASLLELGCGTGEDAIHLARLGARVLATDASPEMIHVARHKAERAGVADRIRFLATPMESLAEVLGEEIFDGAYSNFGAVNCVADLTALARLLAHRLAPGSPLVFVAMGRFVPWEWGWYLAHGDPARAFRRLKSGGVEWRGMTIRYPTPRALRRAMAPHFDARRSSALGFVLPPSYAGAWLDRAPRALRLLSGLDRLTRRFTAVFADHFIFEAESVHA